MDDEIENDFSCSCFYDLFGSTKLLPSIWNMHYTTEDG